MAFYQFLCSAAVVIALSANGCDGECGKMPSDWHQPMKWPWRAVVATSEGKMCLGVLISDEWVLTSINCGSSAKHGAEVFLGGHGDADEGPEGEGQGGEGQGGEGGDSEIPGGQGGDSEIPGGRIEDNEVPDNDTWSTDMPGNQTWSSDMPSGPWPNNQTWINDTSDGQHFRVVHVECSDMAAHGAKKMSGVCLLKLSDSVEFTDSVSPICLPSEDSSLGSELVTYILAGAPYPVAKKIPLVGPRKCKCFYPDRSMGKVCAGRWKMMQGGAYEEEEGDMMGGHNAEMQPADEGEEPRHGGDASEDEMDDCQAGMGAAMMSYQDEAWTLTGMSSGDGLCEDTDMPEFFSDVSAEQEWIMYATERTRHSFKYLYSDYSDPDNDFQCPHKCPYSDPERCDDSIFGSGAFVAPSSPFILLSVLALSLFFTKW